jgi:preprotein translocase subunit SecF
MSEQTTTDAGTDATTGGRATGLKDLASRLYRGEAGIDVVGQRKKLYLVAGAILLIAVITFSVSRFNLGIEFSGGNAFTLPATVDTLEGVQATIEAEGAEVSTAQTIGGSQYTIRVAALDENATIAANKAAEIKQALADKYNIPPESISESSVSGAWGASITRQAFIGALVFLIVVVIYLAAVFREWRMAVAAMAALVLNLVLTAAIYLLVGFEVTPSTIIGFLTILGFALYDVVVVFDRVRENTRGITASTTRTYGEAANLALNQTLMRSINTSLVALLPVGGLLFIGAGLLGAGTLKDLGLVLFVGMLAAFFSSIFFATPVLVDLKEHEPKFKVHKQRVLARRAAGTAAERRPAKTARSGATAAKAGPAKAATPKAGQAKSIPDGEPAETVAGGAPRPGVRPAARKRPGAKPGGSRSGGRSGGKRR